VLFILGFLLILIALAIYKLIKGKRTDKVFKANAKITVKRKIVIALLSIAGLGVLAIIAFFAWWGIGLSGPSKAYIQHFDNTQTTLAAKSTKQFLQNVLANLPLNAQGFTYMNSEYLDGCDADNDDGYQPWQKICTAELVNIYASRVDTQTAEQRLIPIMQQANWQPTPYVYGMCSDQGNNVTDFSSFAGCELLETNANNLGYTPNFEVSDTATSFPSSNSLLTSSGLPEDNEIWVANTYALGKPIVYSSLTKTVNVSGLINNIKKSNYVSFIIITLSKQYFDKNAGFWLIP
jgi:hypothetical protein